MFIAYSDSVFHTHCFSLLNKELLYSSPIISKLNREINIDDYLSLVNYS